jgi:hypothetical protein
MRHPFLNGVNEAWSTGFRGLRSDDRHSHK